MYIEFPYLEVLNKTDFGFLPDRFYMVDHFGGFDSAGHNLILSGINQYARHNNKRYIIDIVQYIEPSIKQLYDCIDLKFCFDFQEKHLWSQFKKYNTHPEIDYKNFVCSFNGNDHVGRKLLVSAIHKFGWFNSEYCSKNFVYTEDVLSGHIQDYVGEQESFYNKFFIGLDSNNFFQTLNSFGNLKWNHSANICNLEHKLTNSFVHVVSETLATSYQPFVTEKFLYSIVTRGLFVCYAQPGWHAHLEKYYGFKKYNKLFDYKFDSIQNPVERLIELMTMLSKFSILSHGEWKDLCLLEQDTIEYNYNHYFNEDYLKSVEPYRDYVDSAWTL
jgi:hypothetical protein